MISDIIRDVNKIDGKYCFDVTLVQSAYASIQPWPNPTRECILETKFRPDSRSCGRDERK